MVNIKIQSIVLIDEQVAIVFEKNWFQEDIVELRQQLLNKLQQPIVKEVTLGADRESTRFTWLNAEFILHFDYYSQSCWFSPHDEISVSKIKPLFALLNQLSES